MATTRTEQRPVSPVGCVDRPADPVRRGPSVRGCCRPRRRLFGRPRISGRVPLTGNRPDAEDFAQEILAGPLSAGGASTATPRPGWPLAPATWPWITRAARAAPPWTPHPGPRPESEGWTWSTGCALCPDVRRDVLLLRHVADVAEREVATRLGCWVGAVKQHIHRDLGALRVSAHFVTLEVTRHHQPRFDVLSSARRSGVRPRLR
jgi:hypothetical protein